MRGSVGWIILVLMRTRIRVSDVMKNYVSKNYMSCHCSVEEWSMKLFDNKIHAEVTVFIDTRIKLLI